jgi:hypothetical protein
MTAPRPTPSPEVCHYTGIDTAAQVGSNEDGSKWARCNCGTTVLDSGTDEEAAAALGKHRGPAPAVAKEVLFKQALTQALEARGLPDVDAGTVTQLVDLLRKVSDTDTKPMEGHTT